MPKGSVQKQLVDDSSPSGQVKEELPYSRSRSGFLTEKQFRVLALRSRGFSQQEIANELGMSRAGVSMLEGRARKQVERARQTLRLYEMTQTQPKVTIGVGTRLQQIPMVVLREADRFHIHLRSNMVEILRMVKKHKRGSLSNGRTTEKITFSFNERGRLSLL